MAAAILFLILTVSTGIQQVYAENNSGYIHIDAELAQGFCFSETELSTYFKPVFLAGNNYYGLSSQGFCSAGDYYIYTRYSSDSSPTTYVVIDKATMKEIGHYEFRTIHSNSLTYNPDTQEVVAVTKSHAFVFDFIDGKLYLKYDYLMNHNCCRIAYIQERQCYFMGTADTIYTTTDFKTLIPYFHYPCIAVNQGMGYDGKLIYINWYTSGFNQIYCYTINGEFVKNYTIKSDIFMEIEEVDFDGADMILNVAASPGHNGLYKIQSNHFYTDWEIKKEASCSKYGEKRRYCRECNVMESERIPPTENHEWSDWIIDEEATCTTDGKRHIECKNCGTYQKSENIKKTGHDYGKWKTDIKPTTLKEGREIRTCSRCGENEYREIQRLLPYIETKKDYIVLNNKEPKKITVRLNVSDYLINAVAEDDSYVSAKTDGNSVTMEPLKTGTTTLTLYSSGGAEEKIKITIKGKMW